MQVYFVRHGETMGNLAMRHQSDATALTARGFKQATEAADFLKTKNPTHVLSSTMVRALETARIIGQTCDMIPETHGVFIEIGRPPRLNGHLLKSAYSLWFYTRWYIGLTSSLKEGGETYKMFRERLQSAKQLLESYPPDARIIVVSHSVFINFFVMHMCDNRPVGPIRALMCFLRILMIKNGSITPLTLNPSASKHSCAWEVEKPVV